MMTSSTHRTRLITYLHIYLPSKPRPSGVMIVYNIDPIIIPLNTYDHILSSSLTPPPLTPLTHPDRGHPSSPSRSSSSSLRAIPVHNPVRDPFHHTDQNKSTDHRSIARSTPNRNDSVSVLLPIKPLRRVKLPPPNRIHHPWLTGSVRWHQFESVTQPCKL